MEGSSSFSACACIKFHKSYKVGSFSQVKVLSVDSSYQNLKCDKLDIRTFYLKIIGVIFCIKIQ